MRDPAMAQATIFQPPTVEAGIRYHFGPCENYVGELDLGQVSPCLIPFSLLAYFLSPYSLFHLSPALYRFSSTDIR
jgi:hypothetical protein